MNTRWSASEGRSEPKARGGGQAARWVLACAAASGVAITCAKVQVPRPLTNASRTDFIRRGEFTFKSEEAVVGEGGKSCASCHENHVPFEDYSLARKFDELPKLVDNCLHNRTKMVKSEFTDVESRALREYVVYNYVLKGVIADEQPEGIKKLGEAMESFLSGDYDGALENVRGARKLVKLQQNSVQSWALEGCIHLFKLNERDARTAFATAVKLDPKVRIDGYVFSPKVLGVLEATRAGVAASSAEPSAEPSPDPEAAPKTN
jgi:hypothetical protein